MRSLAHAREQARAERERVNAVKATTPKDAPPAEKLLAQLTTYLADTVKVDPVEMPRDAMEGKRGAISSDAVLTYVEGLDVVERVEVIAHELGHWLLHKRLSDPSVPRDPVLASQYAQAGTAAVARYSRKMREEAEAIAFALEFLCPSDALFERWRSDDGATTAGLAEELGIPERIVRVQLANGLFEVTMGAAEPRKKREILYTNEQRDGARFTERGRPVLVDAGPGTGKTATLILRIAFLLEEKQAHPSQFLILTFSNEAAQELHERITTRFGADVADPMTISTFHGLGMELLHVHGAAAGYETEFGLLDDNAQAEVVNEILGRVPCPHLDPLADPGAVALSVVEHINHLKHHLHAPDHLERAIAEWELPPTAPNGKAYYANGKLDRAETKRWKEAREARAEAHEARECAKEVLALYREYEHGKAESQQIDFADLILLPLALLEKNREICKLYHEKYPWVLVDEFQDVTRATSRLLRAICGPDNPPWVVGDARQAIYQFLGADADNVRRFERDFENPERFSLTANHRSAEPIVATANVLATQLPDGGSHMERKWVAAAEIQPLGAEPVAIAVAASDYAEGRGVVTQVQQWIAAGVQPGDIAILARRHIDVRNIVLELTGAEISAQAAGMLTAEGAAGDMAAVLTLADRPRGSIIRLVEALGSGISRSLIDATITWLLEREAQEGEDEFEAAGLAQVPAGISAELVAEITRAREAAKPELFKADGFVALTTFLFNGSDYLRRLLAAEATAERAMALVEVVSSLTLATAYRATHKGMQPLRSRRGFAAQLRERLTRFVPIPLIPRPRADTVRVMTCHASKGLEFPAVIVASQTVPDFPDQYPWLPPDLRPEANQDYEQADALLFVGVTRAKRAVVVSYPAKAGEAPGGSAKTLVPLLERWRDATRDEKAKPVPAAFAWNDASTPRPPITIGPIWGGKMPEWFKPSAVDPKICPIQTYLTQFLDADFPEGERELYPRCFGALRKVLRQMATHAIKHGSPMPEENVRALVLKEFPAEKHKNHPHYEWYLDVAMNAALGFSRAFRPNAGELETLDAELEIAPSPPGTAPVKLDLIALYRRKDRVVTALAFRPESFADKVDEGQVGWSGINSLSKRAALVLAHAAHPTLQMELYSGADSATYEYLPSKQAASLPNELDKLKQQHAALARSDFTTDATKWGCDRCRVRVSCPHWIGALD